MTVTTARDDALDLLSGMAVSLRHDVDLDFLLAELATGVRHTLDAERVSVLLLDDDGRLTPAVAVARQHNDELWQRFRRMPPITLDDLPGARRLLAQGEVLVIEDASASPLIPTAWQRTFSLGTLAVAPLVVDEAPAGLVAVEYEDVDASCTPTQLALLEGMAALAGVALRAGRQRSQAQRLEALAATVAELSRLQTTRAVAEQTLTAMLESAHLSTGLFAQLSAEVAEVVAVRGPHLPEPGSYPLAALPAELVSNCRLAWSTEAGALVPVELAGRRCVVVPIGTPPVAAVVLPAVAAHACSEVLGELSLIAAAAAVQLRSTRLCERREWHRRALSVLSSASQHLDAARLSAFVDQVVALLPHVDTTVPTVVVDRSVARATGLPPARGDVARLVARWRRSGRPGARALSGDRSIVPLHSADRVVGALVLGGDGVPAYAEPLVTALGDVISRVVATEHAKELELRAANAATHTAVAARAYREAGQLLGLLSNSLHASAAQSPRTAGAEVLVGQVRRLLRDATEALAPTTAPQADLRTALTALGKQMSAHGGPESTVRQIGSAGLDPAVQVSVLRTAQRLLALLREQRAVAATFTLERSETEVLVTLRTDELVAAAGDGPGLLAARRDARSWLEPVGGRLEISYDGPVHCFVIHAPLRTATRKSGNEATSRQTGHPL